MTNGPRARLEQLKSEPDGRRYSPSAGRNHADVVDALVALLPERGACLEVAAGTGEHAVLAAQRLPGWRWQPTERDPVGLASIAAWVRHAELPNLLPPVALDLGDRWPCEEASLDAVFASNLLHIAPIATAQALFGGAARPLTPGGALLVYGPVFLPDEPRPDGNVAFDRELREQDPAYGVRTLNELDALAAAAGLQPASVRRMPVNNVMLGFARA